MFPSFDESFMKFNKLWGTDDLVISETLFARTLNIPEKWKVNDNA